MKPLFENITKYNKKNYEQFIKFHNKKFSFSYNFYTIIMAILLLLCIVLNLFGKQFTLAFIFVILLTIFFMFRLYFPYKRQQKNEKLYKNNKETICTYSFYKWYFTLNNQTFYYLKLYKVFETDTYFYLYINEEHAALVKKSGFTTGTVDDFRKFIKNNCFLKYKKAF